MDATRCPFQAVPELVELELVRVCVSYERGKLRQKRLPT
jgi:hypothetical protein